MSGYNQFAVGTKSGTVRLFDIRSNGQKALVQSWKHGTEGTSMNSTEVRNLENFSAPGEISQHAIKNSPRYIMTTAQEVWLLFNKESDFGEHVLLFTKDFIKNSAYHPGLRAFVTSELWPPRGTRKETTTAPNGMCEDHEQGINKQSESQHLGTSFQFKTITEDRITGENVMNNQFKWDPRVVANWVETHMHSLEYNSELVTFVKRCTKSSAILTNQTNRSIGYYFYVSECQNFVAIDLSNGRVVQKQQNNEEVLTYMGLKKIENQTNSYVVFQLPQGYALGKMIFS